MAENQTKMHGLKYCRLTLQSKDLLLCEFFECPKNNDKNYLRLLCKSITAGILKLGLLNADITRFFFRPSF